MLSNVTSSGKWQGDLFGLLLITVVAVIPACGQAPQAASSSAVSGERRVSDYTIGPADILNITFTNSPELNGKFRVTDSGDLAMPLLSSPVRAEGLTAIELAQRLAEAFKAAGQLRDPIVNVFVEEHHSRSVMVLGSVVKPSVYELQRTTTVLELLSMAGGLTPTAGTTLTVARKSASPGQSTLHIDLGRLMLGDDPSLNVELRDGDVVSVSAAPVFYVVGAVVKPGGFAVQDAASGMTILQALATAEGLLPTATHDRCLVIRRQSGTKQRQEITVDLSKLMAGKKPDQLLEPNDIVFVPESGTKKAVRTMARVAEQAIVGIATYGVGLRVGNR